MGNGSGRGVEHEVHHGTQALPMTCTQIRLQQGWQPLQGDRIRDRRLASYIDLLISETTALIKAPDLPGHPQSRGTTHPTQQTMHRWMNPTHHAMAMVKAQIAAHGVLQQITQQKLVGKRQLRSGSEPASRGR